MNDITTPVWEDAFSCWLAQMAVAFQNIRPYNINAIQILRTSTNRSICDFCAGPCGDCLRKYSEDPYDCDDCPQDRFGGLTACHSCPFMPLERPGLLRDLE